MAGVKIRLQYRLRTILLLTALVGWGVVALPYWGPICAGWFEWLCYYRANKRAAAIREARDKEFWGDAYPDHIYDENWLRQREKERKQPSEPNSAAD